jgi:hypothetical protein
MCTVLYRTVRLKSFARQVEQCLYSIEASVPVLEELRLATAPTFLHSRAGNLRDSSLSNSDEDKG